MKELFKHIGKSDLRSGLRASILDGCCIKAVGGGTPQGGTVGRRAGGWGGRNRHEDLTVAVFKPRPLERLILQEHERSKGEETHSIRKTAKTSNIKDVIGSKLQ